MVVNEDDIPNHLQSLPRVCPHCSSINVKLRYFNNDKLTQPRFECYHCGKQFTLGGKVRALKRSTKNKKKVKKNSRTSNLQSQCVETGNNDHLIKRFKRQENQTLEVPLTTTCQVKYPPKKTLKNNLEENNLVVINFKDFEEDNAKRNQQKRLKDITKAHLLNAHNILLNIDIEKDDQSKRLSKRLREQAKEVLQHIKKVLVDDGCDQVEVNLQHMVIYNVAIVEEVLQAIETMHFQVESIDIKHVSVWKMWCFEKKAKWVKNNVMELASFMSPTKK